LATRSISTLSDAQFSQQQEKQADAVGLTLLAQEYGHAAGATDFFSRAEENNIPGLAILATHPPSEARVRELENLIKKRKYSVKETLPLAPELVKTVSQTDAAK
jgi:predicted Zn-dependent protease